MSAAADTASPSPRLEVRGLTKLYGDLKALDGADFELRAGEVMALLGENGAGKSTLVKVLAGIIDPDDGEILIEGKPVSLHPVARSQQAGIAVVHQEYSSIRSMSVAENLALSQVDRGWLWWPASARRRAQPLLRAVGLEHIDPGTPMERLSVAEQQLVEIARVLDRDADIVIFDEPTAALADQEIDRVLDVIRRLADEGRSIVYVTHRLPEVFRLADRVSVLRNSRSLEPIEVGAVDPRKIVSMMLGRELTSMYPDKPDLGSEPLLEVRALAIPGLAEPVDFAIRKGEIFGLTGQLGSGAGLVARAIAGVLGRLPGEVTVGGRPISLRSRRAGVRSGIAYCSPDRKRDGIFAERSVTDNLSAPWVSKAAHGGWIDPRKELREATEIGTRFAVDGARMGSPVVNLSGGNQQKVVLGRWLGIAPRVLVVEEPTRGVDVGARAEIYQRLRELCEDGTAILVVSSDTAEIEGLCDTIGTFYRGRLTNIKPAAEWSSDSLALEVMHSKQELAA